MLVEFSIIPLGVGTSLAEPLSRVLKIVADSRIPYKLTPGGTCMEGDWEDVIPIIRNCHQAMRRESSHVFTMVRIEDDAGDTNQMQHNLDSVERHLGMELAK